MSIGAHPADAVERGGGTVAKHLARGDSAMLVSLTTGVVTHAFNIFPPEGEDKFRNIDEVAQTKRDEFERAARAIGVDDWRILEFSESPMLFGLDEYRAMVDLIREYRPTVVLCQHPIEVGRQDHMDSGRFTIAAVDYARAEGFPSKLAPHTVPNLFMAYYEDFRAEQLTGSPRHSPEVIVDISEVIEKKREAMLQFGTTQTNKGEDYAARMDRFLERVDGSVGNANGFGYAERFTRWNPERVQYLPLAE